MRKEEIKARAKETLSFFKESDCGKYGKTFEIMVKSYLNGNRGNSNKVTLKGKHDTQYHGKVYEIKSNCGEINNDFMNNDFVIYTADNKSNYDKPEHAIVTTPEQFINALVSCGLLREKKTTSGYKVKAIQSYSNSKKKSQAWESTLAQFETLEEHIMNR